MHPEPAMLAWLQSIGRNTYKTHDCPFLQHPTFEYDYHKPGRPDAYQIVNDCQVKGP